MLKIAVPVVLIPAHLAAEQTLALLKQTNVKTLFISPKRYVQSQETLAAFSIPEERVFILQGHVEGKISLPDLINHVKLHGLLPVPTQPVRRDTLACIMFSSGTTSGIPKGSSQNVPHEEREDQLLSAIMISHRDLYHSTMQVEVMSQTSGRESDVRGHRPTFSY